MKEFRIEWLSNISDSEKEKLTHKDFSKSEVEEIINDLCISDELKEYAILFFVKDMNISQVAESKYINWQTSRCKRNMLHKEVIKYLKKQYKSK